MFLRKLYLRNRNRELGKRGSMNETKIGSSRLLSVSQVNALTGVKKSTIRYWESEFKDFLKTTRTEGNQRRFNEDAVSKIGKIKELVEEQGLTLKGVRQRLEGSQLVDQNNEPDSETPMSKNIREFADLMSEHVMRRLFKGE